MSASLAIQGLEPQASQYKLLETNPEELITTFQPRQVNIVVTGKGQTTWFVTDFGVGGRGTKVDDFK